jgi:hypothetical protein
MMLTKFHSLKPWFVKNLCEWNISCCHYHIEINELKKVLMLLGVGGKGPMVNVLVLAQKFVILLELIIIM